MDGGNVVSGALARASNLTYIQTDFTAKNARSTKST